MKDFAVYVVKRDANGETESSTLIRRHTLAWEAAHTAANHRTALRERGRGEPEWSVEVVEVEP